MWLVTQAVVQIIDGNFGEYQIESISIDTNHTLSLGLHENENTDTIQEGENLTRPRQFQTNKDTPWNALEHARLWIVTHPNTVALFLVFIATVLLARSRVDSVQALLGFGCLFAGLKIMAATEDGLELPPRYTPSVRTAIPTMDIKAEQS
jgi:hypothetical protein